MKNQKKDKPLRANFTAFENVSYHLNATPLSVAVLAPCAWGGNLVCGVAWQGIVNSAKHNTATNSVWRVFADKTMHGGTANSARQAWQNGVCRQNKAWRHYKFSTEKMEQCLGGGLLSLSLSLSLSLLALFGTLKFLNALFLGFGALFVILSLCKKATQRVARRKPQQKNPHKLKENLLFLDTSLALSMNYLCQI